ncbi:MAG TPA: hypothetical protein DCK98_16380 [Chloroflexi bacterium]|nr:hypothetical protein [Chloroflexota bacterium]HAL26022.1 hypothetical protein [Chloroflexota bacterium]
MTSAGGSGSRVDTRRHHHPPPDRERDTLYWVEGRPNEGGRDVLVRRTPDGAVADVIRAEWTAKCSVRDRSACSALFEPPRDRLPAHRQLTGIAASGD